MSRSARTSAARLACRPAAIWQARRSWRSPRGWSTPSTRQLDSARGVGRRGRRVPVDVHGLRDRLQLRRVLRLDGRGLRHRQGRHRTDVLDHDRVLLRPRPVLGPGRRSRRTAPADAGRRGRARGRPAADVAGALDLARLRHLRHRGRGRRRLRVRPDGRHRRGVVPAPAHRRPRRRGGRDRRRHARRGADLGAPHRRLRLAHRVRRARHRRRRPAARRQPRRVAPARHRRPGAGAAAPDHPPPRLRDHVRGDGADLGGAVRAVRVHQGLRHRPAASTAVRRPRSSASSAPAALPDGSGWARSAPASGPPA